MYVTILRSSTNGMTHYNSNLTGGTIHVNILANSVSIATKQHKQSSAPT